MLLTALPSDILILVLQGISVRELAALSRTCRLLNSLVTEFGWNTYLRANPRPSFSLSQTRIHWPAKTQVRYDFLADRSWSRCEFVARPFSRPWSNNVQPVLAISHSRLIVAAGPRITSYKFGVSGPDNASPPIHLEGTFSFAPPHGRSSDITSITFVDDGGLDLALCIGFQDGTLQHVCLKPPTHANPTSLGVACSTSSQLHGGDFFESLSSERSMLLSLSSNGSATLTNLEASALPETVALNARSWVSHICLDSSGPYAAFGTSSTCPLRVHSILNGQILHSPTAILHTNIHSDLPPPNPVSSAVYGISRAPLASPWGASPQILVSGWFDGKVRCYDLRSSSRAIAEAGSPKCPAPLRPVLTMRDPLQLESIYSVSCGGGSSSHVAAGSARHSVVCFWDIRSAKAGWSVHAPGNDRSPVYSVILESSRLYGATQSRPFVYDFGPEVDLETYPRLPEGRGVDGLKRKKGSSEIGYYVTKYPHTTRGVPTNES
ncbi:hypothetical protein D9615_002918 [Tricholomella constricta]|uniref:F-box domain-containing protein n=1 Tax=Tricholomella constricta TaxID=117010 RepID=A0A8H5HG93_9AGAR|nr:hypothetical protein D9615_002918 [Tricholomella constricta]